MRTFAVCARATIASMSVVIGIVRMLRERSVSLLTMLLRFLILLWGAAFAIYNLEKKGEKYGSNN